MGLYNCETTLHRAVASVMAQSYTRWELIMCDDCSTDNTYTIACRLSEQDNRIKVLKNDRNVGCNIVLNRCIEAAQGEYIAIMDSDDESLPRRLEREVEILNKNPQYALVSTGVSHFDERGDYMTFRRKEQPRAIDFARAIPHCHPACMIRRSAFMAIGCYETEKGMHRIEDYYMMARLYAHGYRGYNLQEVLYRYYDNREAYARRNWQTRLNEFHTYNKAMKLLQLPFYTHIYSLRPFLVGILPHSIYDILHRRPWQRKG